MFQQPSVTASVFFFKKKKKNQPLMPQEQKSKLPAFVGVVRNADASAAVPTTRWRWRHQRLLALRNYILWQRTGVIRASPGPRCGGAAGCLRDVCLRCLIVFITVGGGGGSFCPLPSPPSPGSDDSDGRQPRRKALRAWQLGALCSPLKLCPTVPSWSSLPPWATFPLISQHFL